MKKEIEVVDNNSSMLEIFKSEEDLKGSDILKMSDFFTICSENAFTNAKTKKRLRKYKRADLLVGRISEALNLGYSKSQEGVLVADMNSIPTDILSKLKSGEYHIGISKEVEGNFRPGIFDEKEHVQKWITLKSTSDPTAVLSNVTNVCIQAALKNISLQIEELQNDVTELIDINRRVHLSNYFIMARNELVDAAYCKDEADKKNHIERANDFLNQGMVNVFSDLSAQVNKLSEVSFFKVKTKELNKILNYIYEDMQMAPKYAGVRAYCFMLLGRDEAAINVLEQYQYQIRSMDQVRIGEYTPFELIHTYSKYNDENLNYWINKPKELQLAIDNCKDALLLENGKCFFIEVDD